MTPCPECERNKFRAAMWRAEAYKQAGHDKIERPWVGLTDDDRAALREMATFMDETDCSHLLSLTEERLKEKNR